MEPSNFDIQNFVQQMEEITKGESGIAGFVKRWGHPEPVSDQKIENLALFLEQHKDSLENMAYQDFSSQALGDKFAELAKRVSLNQNNPNRQAIEEKLISYANKLLLFPQKTAAQEEQPKTQEDEPSSEDLMEVSVEQETTIPEDIRTFTGTLTGHGITTADRVIQYAHQYGPGLTFMDISGIEFSREKINELLKLVPRLESLVAQNCKLDDACADEIANSKTVKKLVKLDLRNNEGIRSNGINALNWSQKNFEDIQVSTKHLTGMERIILGPTRAALHYS